MEEKRILDKINQYLEQDDFNLIDFADKTTQRAIILAAEKAEFALGLAESDLADVRSKISEVQKDLNLDLEHGFINSVAETKKSILKELNRQEGIIKKRVDEAQAHLKRLTDAILSKTPHDQPKS